MSGLKSWSRLDIVPVTVNESGRRWGQLEAGVGTGGALLGEVGWIESLAVSATLGEFRLQIYSSSKF